MRRAWRHAALTSVLGLLLSGLVGWTPLGAAPATLRLSVEPTDQYHVLFSAVRSAHHSIDLEMYELQDVSFVKLLGQRRAAGVAVRVVLNSKYYGRDSNATAYALLRQEGVSVHWASSSEIYHAKFLITDGSTLYVSTGNLTSEYYATSRDFVVTDRAQRDIAAAETAFSSDFTGGPRVTPSSSNLVFSPNAESAVLSLINGARHSLWIENEEMSSSYVVAALRAAAQRGVAVHIIMTYSSSWTDALDSLMAAGASVRLFHGEEPLYIHAKVLCADCSATGGTVLVGSQNFSTSSLVYNRELGVETTQGSIVSALWRTLRSDYALALTNP